MSFAIPEDCRMWWASVKYKNYNNETEYVIVSKIFEEDPGTKKRTPFLPKSYTDFVFGKLYCIKTSRGSSDSKEHTYYGVIGRMAGSKEELKSTSGKRSRVHWPVLHESEHEPVSTADELEPLNGVFSESRTLNQRKTASKKCGQYVRFKNYMGTGQSNLLSQESSSSAETSSSVQICSSAQSGHVTVADNMSPVSELPNKHIDDVKDSFKAMTDKMMKFFEEKFILLEGKVDALQKNQTSMEDLNKAAISSIREEIIEVKNIFRESPNYSKVVCVQNWVNSLPN